jgi:uncharacterized protein (TIGR04255 family)
MSLGKKYKNPPLIEALCDFTFGDDGIDFNEIEAEIKKVVANILPQKSEKKNLNILLEHKGNSISTESNESKGFIQFIDPDKNRMIQIGDKYLL